MVVKLAHVIAILIAALVAAAPSRAESPYDPGGFRFSSPTYAVHENDGRAVITIVRSDTSREAHADYIAVGMGHPCGAAPCTATSPADAYHAPGDFAFTKGTLGFPAGVSSRSFAVPIVDHHFSTISKTCRWESSRPGRLAPRIRTMRC